MCTRVQEAYNSPGPHGRARARLLSGTLYECNPATPTPTPTPDSEMRRTSHQRRPSSHDVWARYRYGSLGANASGANTWKRVLGVRPKKTLAPWRRDTALTQARIGMCVWNGAVWDFATSFKDRNDAHPRETRSARVWIESNFYCSSTHDVQTNAYVLYRIYQNCIIIGHIWKYRRTRIRRTTTLLSLLYQYNCTLKVRVWAKSLNFVFFLKVSLYTIVQNMKLKIPDSFVFRRGSSKVADNWRLHI